MPDEHRHAEHSASEETTAAGAADQAPDYETLLLRAGFNFHVFLAAAFGFGAERGATPDAFVDWVAGRLESTWSGLRGHGADAVLRLVLENLASTGYQIEDLHYDANTSHATVHAIPLGLGRTQWQQILAPFGVTPDQMHRLFRVFVPLARAAGARLELAGVRDTLRITVRRDAPDEEASKPSAVSP